MAKKKTKTIQAEKIVNFQIEIPADTPDDMVLTVAKICWMVKYGREVFDLVLEDMFQKDLQTAAGTKTA